MAVLGVRGVDMESAVLGVFVEGGVKGEALGPMIFEKCCCTSFEKSSLECSKSPASEIGRTLPLRAMSFHPEFPSHLGARSVSLVSLLSPFPALCNLSFSISSANQSRVSLSMSSG